MNEVRFGVGSYVMYKTDGICRIADVRFENFTGSDAREYYVLEPLGTPGTVTYVPVGSDNISRFMRAILTAEEIGEAIEGARTVECQWHENSKVRSQFFKDILAEGDTVRILWIVKVLTRLRIETEKNRKKMYISDLRALEAAEKIVTDEFSFVLDIPRTEVMDYILTRIDAH